MKIIRPFFPIVVMLCVCQLAFPQTFAIQDKPRAVVVMDDTGKAIASIPADTAYQFSGLDYQSFAFSQFSHMLYVRNPDEKSKGSPRILSVVNPATGHVDREITVGAGKYARLLMSKDGRRLFCYTGISEMGYLLPWGAPTHWLRPPFDPKISVIDTGSNKVIAIYEPFPAFRDAVPKKDEKWLFYSDLLTTANGGHMIVLCWADEDKRKPHLLAQRINVFSGQSPSPAFAIDPGGPVRHWTITEDGRFLVVEGEGPTQEVTILSIARLETGAVKRAELSGTLRMTALSRDSQSVFVAVDKEKKGSTVLDIVDLESGKVSERPLIDRPAGFLRLGSQQAMWVINNQEMRSLSETGELGDKPILLNKPRKREEQDREAESVFLDGYPGETISVAGDRAAMLIVGANGATRHRVALLDLKQLQVDTIVRTMTAAEENRIRAANMSKFLLESALQGAVARGLMAGATHGMTGPYVYNLMLPAIPLAGFTNEMLAARSDGKYLYALDTDSHEVTVIDVSAGTVLKRIPVDHSIALLQPTADGKHLLCLGKQFQRINLDSNNLEN